MELAANRSEGRLRVYMYVCVYVFVCMYMYICVYECFFLYTLYYTACPIAMGNTTYIIDLIMIFSLTSYYS